jgi:hypothetical protein
MASNRKWLHMGRKAREEPLPLMCIDVTFIEGNKIETVRELSRNQFLFGCCESERLELTGSLEEAIGEYVSGTPAILLGW